MSDATQFTFAYLVLFSIARSIESISHVNLPPPLFFKRATNLEYHTHLPPLWEPEHIWAFFTGVHKYLLQKGIWPNTKEAWLFDI